MEVFCDQNLFQRQIPIDLKKSRFSHDDYKSLRCETLYIGDYEYVNVSSSAVLGIKLWLEEDIDLNRNFIHSNSFNRKVKVDTKCYHLLAITL